MCVCDVCDVDSLIWEALRCLVAVCYEGVLWLWATQAFVCREGLTKERSVDAGGLKQLELWVQDNLVRQYLWVQGRAHMTVAFGYRNGLVLLWIGFMDDIV